MIDFAMRYADMVARFIGWLVIVAGLILWVLHTSKIDRSDGIFQFVVIGWGFYLVDADRQPGWVERIRSFGIPLLSVRRRVLAPVMPIRLGLLWKLTGKNPKSVQHE